METKQGDRRGGKRLTRKSEHKDAEIENMKEKTKNQRNNSGGLTSDKMKRNEGDEGIIQKTIIIIIH